ncbi:hypothetical protein R3P38DRAFT_3205151 [Favolaschia claudopus]|uniref:F-box domain-containing protein n=1 Tax=Favolaschia claudopus TaxID=2862362 RepID=A0AAW0ARE4_9AGAR
MDRYPPLIAPRQARARELRNLRNRRADKQGEIAELARQMEQRRAELHDIQRQLRREINVLNLPPEVLSLILLTLVPADPSKARPPHEVTMLESFIATARQFRFAAYSIPGLWRRFDVDMDLCDPELHHNATPAAAQYQLETLEARLQLSVVPGTMVFKNQSGLYCPDVFELISSQSSRFAYLELEVPLPMLIYLGGELIQLDSPIQLTHVLGTFPTLQTLQLNFKERYRTSGTPPPPPFAVNWIAPLLAEVCASNVPAFDMFQRTLPWTTIRVLKLLGTDNEVYGEDLRELLRATPLVQTCHAVLHQQVRPTYHPQHPPAHDVYLPHLTELQVEYAPRPYTAAGERGKDYLLDYIHAPNVILLGIPEIMFEHASVHVLSPLFESGQIGTPSTLHVTATWWGTEHLNDLYARWTDTFEVKVAWSFICGENAVEWFEATRDDPDWE